MANYIFENMTDADAEAFQAGDTLRFSSSTATPANVTFSNTGLNITFVTSGGKTLAFEGPDLAGGEIEFTSSFIDGTETAAFVGTNTADGFSVDNGDGGNYAYGFAGDDSIAAGAGGDNIFGGAGGDSLFGGAAGDHLYGFGLGSGASADGDDSINGNGGNDYIQGNAGADTLNGGAGRDRILGGADNDVIDAGDDNDTVNGNKGEDDIDGGAGNDSLRGGADNDVLDGGSGNDVLQGDLGDDEITGNDGEDLINGGDGNDVLSGGNGNDVVSGDAGDDSISGGSGNDVLSGGAGNDILDGGAGFDTLTGGDGEDAFIISDAAISGGKFDDEGAFDFVETVTDFVSGTDTLQIGFTVGTAGVVTPDDVIFLTAESAATYAATQNLAANTVLALEVGDDTYLFYETASTLTAPNAVVLLSGVDSVDDADFVVSV